MRTFAKLFVAAPLVALAFSVGFACSSKDEVIEVPAPKCPTDRPMPGGDAGDSCDLTEGKVCTYAGSGKECEPSNYTATCKNKKWEYADGPPKEAACPGAVPQNGAPCSTCLTQACKYSAKCSGVYTQDVYTATCNNGSFKVEKIPNCQIAGGSDAGTD